MTRPPKSVLLLALAAVVVGAAVVALVARGGTKAASGSPPPPPATSTSTATTMASNVAPMPPGWLRAENAKPGVSNWRLTKLSHHHEIEGYAGAVSAQRGDTVALYVSTTAPTYLVTALRMGYYGGAGARVVWSSPPQSGHAQPPPRVSATTHMVETSWAPSLRVTIAADWPPGDYLFKLESDTGFQSWIPLTVRDDASTTGLLINNSVTTWQAYNLWGGADLYGGQNGSFATRARVVSFDRPYLIGDGSGDFLGNEFPFVSLVESLGNDVSYTTDVDLDLHPDLLLRHHALISLGHDEYWSTAMRDGVTAARDRGVNLAFLGANAIFRHIRFDASPLGPDRQEIDYKAAAEDPLNGVNNAEVTPLAWRDPPNNRPEDDLLGELYQCNPVSADLVVYEASSWLFDGAGLHAGEHVPKVVGSEYDGWQPSATVPKNVEVVAHSLLSCRGAPGYADFTYYSAASGAGVVDTGTNQWVPLLTNPSSEPVLVRVTENILAAFAAGPAGIAHPSTPNTSGLPRAPARRNPPPESPATTTHPATTAKKSTTTTAGRLSTTTAGTTPPPTAPPPTAPPPTTSGPTTTA